MPNKVASFKFKFSPTDATAATFSDLHGPACNENSAFPPQYDANSNANFRQRRRTPPCPPLPRGQRILPFSSSGLEEGVFCQKVSVLLREKIAFRGCKLGPKGDVLAVGGREVLLHVKPDEVDDPPGSAQNF